MTEVEIALVLLLLVMAALIVMLIVRRNYLLRGSGGISLSVRAGSKDDVERGGWALGVGRFARDELQWYRLVGLGIRPAYVLHRSELEVTGRRAPQPQEARTLPPDAVILDCRHGATLLELAVVGTAATGFSSWLESAAPDVGLS
jgi:hypothetical protein